MIHRFLLPEGRRCSARHTGLRQVPSQKMSRTAVDHQHHAEPVVLATPEPAKIRSPSLMLPLGARSLRFDSRTLIKRALLHLPALELEDPLHGLLVHA